MADKLNMKWQDMEMMAKQFNGFHQDIERMTKAVKDIISQKIDSKQWEGEAAQAFREEYDKIKDNLSKFSNVCLNTSKTIKSTSEQFKSADSNVAKGLRGKQ